MFKSIANRTSVYSIQAIVISTEVAHNLGYSQMHAVLFATATRAAQILGLHKITAQDPHLGIVEADVSIGVEVGRRTWNQMLLQDLFATPFIDIHGN